jgi:hypothetical protein
VKFLLDQEEVDWDTFWNRMSDEVDRGKIRELRSALRLVYQFHTAASTTKLIRILRANPIKTPKHSDLWLSRAALAEFYRILTFCATLQVRDPRDRIFALFEISQTLGIELPTPDYTKSVDAVFKEARIALSKKTHEVKTTWKTHERYFLGPQSRGPLYLPPTQAYRITPTLARSRVHDTQQYQTAESEKPYKKPRSAQRTQYNLPLRMASESPLAKPHDIYDKKEALKVDKASSNGDLPPSDPSNLVPGKKKLGTPEPETSARSDRLEGSYQSFFHEILEQHKHILLCRVIDQLKSIMFRGKTTSCVASGGSSAVQSEAGRDSGRSIGELNGKPRGNCRKREENDEDDDEDEDEESEEKRPRKQLKGSMDPRDRFACPYFQRNSQGPRLKAACRGLGFKTIARLKYVNHGIYLHCIY